MGWLAEMPALIGALLVLYAPGALLGLALGLRGLVLWALAPAASVAVLTCSALVLGQVGLPWRPIPALICVVIVAGVAAGVRLGLRLPAVPDRSRGRSGGAWLLAAGIAAGIVLTALRVGLYIGEPGSISQTNDASFHLNALRFAVETGAASPLKLTTMIGASTFYPSAWHVLASMVVQTTGASVAVAANAVTLVIAAGCWPIGLALLARSLGGSVAGAIAAASAAAVPAFPLLMIQWGVLYPQLLAVALLPAAIALIAMIRPLLGPGGAVSWLRPAVLLLMTVAALLLSQPSVVLAWIVAAFMFATFELVRLRTALEPRRLRAAIVILVLAASAATLVWFVFGRSVEGTWPPSASPAVAVLEVIVNGHLGYPWAVGLSILAIIGLIEAVRRPTLRWFAATWAVYAVLYIVAASIGSRLIRSFLVDPWYDDPYRLAALLPTIVVPLAGLGAAVVVRLSAAALHTRSRRAAWTAFAVVVTVGAASIAVAPQIARRDVFAHRIDPNLYASTTDSYVSRDERALMDRLAESVPADAVIIGNPGTGMAFGYALSGRNVVPRTWSPPPSAAYTTLWESLRDAASDPGVCPALEAFGATYVLDFGPGEEYPGRWIMPGFDDLEDQPGFELVDRQGEARLWRVTACD